MIVDPRILEEHFRLLETDALSRRIDSGELTPEAVRLARAELAAREVGVNSPTRNNSSQAFVADPSDTVPKAPADRQPFRFPGSSIAVVVIALGAASVFFVPRIFAAHHLVTENGSQHSETVSKDGKPFIQGIEMLAAKDLLINGSVDDYVRTMGIGSATSDATSWRVFLWRGDGVETALIDRLDAKPMPIDWAHPEREAWLARAHPSDSALFMFRERVAGIPVSAPVTGRIPGVVVDSPYLDGWKQSIVIGGQRFALEAHSEKGPDGQDIDGSLRLEMLAGNGMRSVILAGAPGHVFSELRLMWGGQLDGQAMPAFYIRRTLVTGEVHHILSVASTDAQYRAGGWAFDPDRPVYEFTSGVGELEEGEVAAANAPGDYPDVILPPAVMPASNAARSGEIALPHVTIYAPPEEQETDGSAPRTSAQMSIPASIVVGEKTFIFGGKPYRIVVERRSTLAPDNARGPSFSHDLAFGSYWGGDVSLVVWLYQGDRRQALLVTSPAMDSGISMSAGDFDSSGALSLSMDYSPHYNNGMTYEWRAVGESGRLVRRTRVSQAQGC